MTQTREIHYGLSPNFPFRKAAVREALEDNETPAIVLMMIASAGYSHLLWPEHHTSPMDNGAGIEPVELWALIEKDFGVRIDVTIENKINAARSALESDSFYEEPEAFIAITKGMIEGDVDDMISGELEELSAPEIIMAILEVSLMRDDEEHEMAPPVIAIINEELRKETEDDTDGAHPIQELVDRHKQEIKSWLLKLGANPKLIENF